MTVPNVEQDEPRRDGDAAAPVLPAPTLTAGAVVTPAAAASEEGDELAQSPEEQARRSGESEPGGADGPEGGFSAPAS
ncbi:hypothetical protein [Motilibacter aurantiacus]|uniref:hypothetical protein n=1 Tax=Motilibacter aurantiacus TaxID=2714955 RepID=UPI0014079DE8|nr:hypothetical protein [Motilibacter aurantiacus]NHC45841.1 hypothetical protein [Motilibacter aurantiacus]